MSKTTETTKTFVVFSMKKTAELMAMGHQYLRMLPNPKYPGYHMWEFEDTEDFRKDYDLISKGDNYHGNER